jgi:hypothetical protein
MFKYVWIIIIFVVWLLWGLATIKDIIRTLQDHGYDNVFELLDDLEPESAGFIVCTLLVLGIASLIAWLMSLAG